MKISYFCIMAAVATFPIVSGVAHADEASVRALVGKTWKFEQGGSSGVVIYKKSSVSVTFSDGTVRKGKLRLKGDQICTTYKEIRNGKETCFGASRSGKGYKTTSGAILTPK